MWLEELRRKTPGLEIEKAVDNFVWDIRKEWLNSPENGRLLQHLGYTEGVRYQGDQDYKPDFVISVGDKHVALIEDKKPTSPIQNAIKQLVRYFKTDYDTVPIGLAFNAREMAVVINTSLSELKDFREFTGQALISAKADEEAAALELLLCFRADRLLVDAVSVAKELAVAERDRVLNEERVHKDQVRARTRTERITARLQEIRDEPSVEVVAAILKADEILCKVRPKPTVQECTQLWRRPGSASSDGIEVFGEYDGKPFNARFYPANQRNKRLKYGDEWLSASEAAEKAINSVRGKPVASWRGPTFWKYRDGDKLIPILEYPNGGESGDAEKRTNSETF